MSAPAGAERRNVVVPLRLMAGYPVYMHLRKHRHMAPSASAHQRTGSWQIRLRGLQFQLGVIASEHGYIPLIDAGDDLNGAAEVLREIEI